MQLVGRDLEEPVPNRRLDRRDRVERSLGVRGDERRNRIEQGVNVLITGQQRIDQVVGRSTRQANDPVPVEDQTSSGQTEEANRPTKVRSE